MTHQPEAEPNLKAWLNKRVIPKPSSGYTGIFIVRGVTTAGVAYIRREGNNMLFSISLDELELVEEDQGKEQPHG